MIPGTCPPFYLLWINYFTLFSPFKRSQRAIPFSHLKPVHQMGK